MANLFDLSGLPVSGNGALSQSSQSPAQPKPKGSLNYLVQAQSIELMKTQDEGVVKHKDPSLNTRLAKSILNVLDNGNRNSIERLAFERDPIKTYDHAGLYRPKLQLVPDPLLKRIAIQDDLVAAILTARQSHMSKFGRIQPDRHSYGFKLVVDPKKTSDLNEEQKKELQDRVDKLAQLLLTCGSEEKVDDTDRCSFSEYLSLSARNALVFGRFATEILFVEQPGTTERKVHAFRPADAGTIYYASEYADAGAEAVREDAVNLLEHLRNERFKPERHTPKEFSWIQVIEGKPVQAFTDKEMLVCNCYPTTDWELGGYPLTPIDTMLSAVITHINITSHNKAYFQSGRASRGMLIMKSNEINLQMVEAMRQQFNAAINGVQNAWRMPVFGCTPEDEITWQAIDAGGRDMEFQYLSDTVSRVVLSAFQMSPEELPGYQHLSRGTNNQALSETNNEYKLEAARDVGIRPLIARFEDFLNSRIIPLFDPVLAKLCKIQLLGLDIDTEEKESVRLQEDMPIHMTYNEVLERVEKDPMPREVGGDFPLNPQFQAIVEKYMTFGQILEFFFDRKGASQDPSLQFYQNQMWMGWTQQQQQMQMAQQAQQQQPQPADPQQADEQSGDAEKSELASGMDQLLGMVGKSEGSLLKALPPSKAKLRAQHEVANKLLLEEWLNDSKKMLDEVASIVDQHAPKSKP